MDARGNRRISIAHLYRLFSGILFSICRILFKVFQRKDYVINGDRLRGVHELDLRTLDKAGYQVIPIHLERWQELLDYEKIPYLMKQIREKENHQVA